MVGSWGFDKYAIELDFWTLICRKICSGCLPILEKLKESDMPVMR